MLANKKRITKIADFEKIKKHGRSYFFSNIELKIGENKLDTTRIGFVIEKAFSKKAVERNKAKRQAREIMRNYLTRIVKNKDILIIIRKKTFQKKEKNQIGKNIRKALEKAGIQCK